MKKLHLLAFTFLIISLLGCSDTILNELNIDTKRSNKVSAESLITNAQIHLSYFVNNTNVNEGVLRLINQYWTETTYTDEANYILNVRRIPLSNWIRLYTDDVLKSLKDAQDIAAADSGLSDNAKKNLSAVIEVLSVQAYVYLVETFGNIPYTGALNSKNLLPKYDDAKTVYLDLVSRIDVAIATLKAASGSVMTASQDVIYSGSASKWLAYAASLKLKMAITLADDDAANAKTMAEAALPDVFQNEAASARVTYQSSAPNTNPLYEDLTLSGRNDFVPAKGLVDVMNEMNDPRRKFYFTLHNGAYVGGTSGSSNAYSDFSHIHPDISGKANRPGELLSYTAVKFFLAEGAARGWTMGGTAADLYNEAITASILEWGGTAGDVVLYLGQSSVTYNQAEWKAKIGLQKWIAMYGIPHEGWVSLRLLDEPKLSPPTQPESGFPARFFYPQEEQTKNKTNYEKAKEAIGGKDNVTVKIFWDKTDYQNK